VSAHVRVEVLALLLAAAALVACSRGGTTPAAISTATPAPIPTLAPTVVLAPGFADVAALNGLRCVGQWRNTAYGSSGAFAAKVEAGGGGGSITLELGGNVFGGSGGVFEAPFRLVGRELEINAHSDLLGHVDVHIGLDGKSTGELSGTPALGPRSSVTLTQYSMSADRGLRLTMDINPGDGRPAAISTVEAACSR